MFLDAPHDVHNALVNLRQIAFRQRSCAAALHVVEHGTLAVRLVNRQAGVAFEPSNLYDRGRAFVEQRRQFAV